MTMKNDSLISNDSIKQYYLMKKFMEYDQL